MNKENTMAEVRQNAAPLVAATLPPHLGGVPAAREWLKTAQRGAKRVYHVGHLIVDRGFTQKDGNKWTFKRVEPLHSLARLLQEAEAKGEVYLLQRRLGDGEYVYYAIKRTHGIYRKSRWKA